MTQSRTDSLMEAGVNTIIGLAISTIANHIILPLTLGVTPTLGQNLVIGLAFTAISLARSYTLRRVFNGKGVWVSLKGFHRNPYRNPYWKMALLLPVGLLYVSADAFTSWCDKHL
jgi:hypothetical protein